MRDGYFDTGDGGNSGGQLFCEIHGAMLSAGAAKRYLKMIPPILPVLVDRLANENLDQTEKLLDFFRQPPEEIGDRLVTPCIKPQRLIPERIGHRPAIETKPPPLPVESSGNPRLYENDMTDTFIACLLSLVRRYYTIIRKRLKEISLPSLPLHFSKRVI